MRADASNLISFWMPAFRKRRQKFNSLPPAMELFVSIRTSTIAAKCVFPCLALGMAMIRCKSGMQHIQPSAKYSIFTIIPDYICCQVITSIQGLILVHDPYFNEPGFEQTRGTQRGTDVSSTLMIRK